MTRKTRIRAAVVTATALVASATVTAGVGVAGPWWGGDHKRPTKAEIAGLFDDWNAALQTGDAEKVADLYAKDAVLLPTVSNKVRTDRAGIVDYFEHFQANKPVGKKIETHINILDNNSALDAGVYQFALTDHETGEKSTVTARYTYEYEKRGGEWRIVNHHSSAMPEG
ncbi:MULTISPECIES: SgcJ/EcaC family oxidoreductase [unclassified Streptomyces]|uniref:SgcJ/EcaC family oxidoreductase n=1 Tax=unclassified Streptomyces TaxID=2593676 RepID=UPI00148919F9|nr:MULTISPECIES: SgcJ/EcaC family oxidoreductase [unclassified Streptomyces]